MRRSRALFADPVLDMTPMIDCVFLLMIFFALVIDLSQKDLEDLVLPQAEFSVPDEQPPENRPVVNVMQDGRVKCQGTLYWDPQSPRSDAETAISRLALHLREFVRATRRDRSRAPLSDEPVLIRADKWTRWEHVATVIEGFRTPSAGFHRLELALSEVDKEIPRTR
jgi:biopolymer transport protein ExbD